MNKQITKLNNSTISKEFKPTPHMIVWIDTAVRLMTDNITEIETESKITAQSWHGWVKNPDFRVWFKEEWNKRISGEAWKLDVIGMKQARKNHDYWQDMMRRTGNLVDAPQQTNIQVNNVIKDKKNEYDI